MRKRTNETVGCLPSRSREGPGEGTSPTPEKNRPSHAANGSSAAEPGSQHPSRKREGDHVAERSCILTRRTAPREELIRLALGPDGGVAPDIRARAPGRGAWIGVGRDELDAANAKGKLKGALARAFRTNDLQVPADLADRIAAALRQAALDRLGLEARGGTLINGADKIETAARAGKVRLLLHAADAGEDGRRALDQAWRVGGGEPQGLVFPEGRTILSLALGRENVVHVALIDPAAARRVRHAIDRWLTFIAPDAGLEGGDPAAGHGSADEFDEGQE